MMNLFHKYSHKKQQFSSFLGFFKWFQLQKLRPSKLWKWKYTLYLTNIRRKKRNIKTKKVNAVFNTKLKLIFIKLM